jgi:hypothetical protein
MPNRRPLPPFASMTDLDTLDLASQDPTESHDEPHKHQAMASTRPATPRPSATPTLSTTGHSALALLSDTGAAHLYISKTGWLDLLRHIATIGTDGMLTAPADFLAVQLALYSGLAVSTEFAAAREAERTGRAPPRYRLQLSRTMHCLRRRKPSIRQPHT